MDTPETIAAQETAEQLERCFAAIGATRMEGVPILNAALRVQAVGTREWQGFWLSVLITPWFLNLMLLPRQQEEDDLPVGSKRSFAFPAGAFEFIRGREEALGGYWMCSLFSPVLEFTDQEAAEATAAAALEELFAADEAEPAEAEMAMIWRGELPAEEESEPEAEGAEESRSEPTTVSRRAFLRGPAAREESQA
ncbi:[NiFe]-hydrogenase assembly chaperone HybE [Pelagibius marinus]|uniref:[NiFe]-hydrogenase assembly chaperone HybE n=1 Tax=Pelagibius marinus TaxID=2762760 RepID=UPI0018731282|nr:[NiFe]-hydrogenase assembly chaperone HybE [Pelagibius marinus]